MIDDPVRLAERPWLAHYPPQVPATLEYPAIPLTALLEQTASRYGDRTAIIFFNRRMSYRDLYERARRLAGGLKAQGVGPGGRVAVMLPNCPQAVIAYYATLLLGATVVMVNPTYTPRELAHQLSDAGATHLIFLDLLWKTVSEVRSRVPVREYTATSLSEFMPWALGLAFRLKYRKQLLPIPYGPGMHRWAEAAAAAPVTEPSPAGPGDLALLQYTGGTTGLPKGCMLTHKNLVANCVQTQAWVYKLRPGEAGAVVGALPFFHVYGMTAVMNYCVMSGRTMILVPRFDPGEILKLIARYRPTVFPGAPTMYIALLAHPDLKKYDLSSVEVCVSGASALPLEVQEAWEKVTGGKLVEGYGLSEASPITHANPPWDERRSGSIGLPWPDTDARIVDSDSGAPLPVGEAGELELRGPQVMLGYWNRPEENDKVFHEGWLRTGDIAIMDPSGYFRIADRKKDVIIASGFKIFPREVEEVLFAHPDVQEACVVGVPDSYRGESPKAFVVLRPGHQVAPDALHAYLKENLAPYKVPREIAFRDSLPKNLIGKVLRRELRDEEIARRSGNTQEGNPK